MKSILFGLIPCLLLGSTCYSQNDTLNANSFDFWIGEWEMTWTDRNGKLLHGTNKLERILDGKVIQENFYDPTNNYKGKSWSTWNPQTNTWKQVWTDNQSGFLEFVGAKSGDSLMFKMKPIELNGNMVERKMIFYNITENSFTWDWIYENVESGTRRLSWRLNYKRKKSD